MEFDGHDPTLRSQKQGRRRQGQTDPEFDAEGNYVGAKVRINEEWVHRVDLDEVLIHEVGHSRDYRRHMREAVSDGRRGNRGERPKESRAERFRKDDKRMKKGKAPEKDWNGRVGTSPYASALRYAGDQAKVLVDGVDTSF